MNDTIKHKYRNKTTAVFYIIVTVFTVVCNNRAIEVSD